MLNDLKKTFKNRMLVATVAIATLTLSTPSQAVLDPSEVDATTIVTCAVFLAGAIHLAKLKLPPIRLLTAIPYKSLMLFKWSHDAVNGISSGDAFIESIGDISIELGDLGFQYRDGRGRSIQVTGSGTDEIDISVRPKNDTQQTNLQTKMNAIAKYYPDLSIGQFNLNDGFQGTRIIADATRANAIVKALLSE